MACEVSWVFPLMYYAGLFCDIGLVRSWILLLLSGTDSRSVLLGPRTCLSGVETSAIQVADRDAPPVGLKRMHQGLADQAFL